MRPCPSCSASRRSRVASRTPRSEGCFLSSETAGALKFTFSEQKDLICDHLVPTNVCSGKLRLTRSYHTAPPADLKGRDCTECFIRSSILSDGAQTTSPSYQLQPQLAALPLAAPPSGHCCSRTARPTGVRANPAPVSSVSNCTPVDQKRIDKPHTSRKTSCVGSWALLGTIAHLVLVTCSFSSCRPEVVEGWMGR